jgi:hypothetical protein
LQIPAKFPINPSKNNTNFQYQKVIGVDQTMDIKAGHSSNNKSSLDSENSLLEKLESELKTIIFGVLFILLKEEDSSLILAMLVSFWMFLQLLIFPFHSNVSSNT